MFDVYTTKLSWCIFFFPFRALFPVALHAQNLHKADAEESGNSQREYSTPPEWNNAQDVDHVKFQAERLVDWISLHEALLRQTPVFKDLLGTGRRNLVSEWMDEAPGD